MYTYEMAPVYVLMENYVTERLLEYAGFTNGDGMFFPGILTRYLCFYVFRGAKLTLFVLPTHPPTYDIVKRRFLYLEKVYMFLQHKVKGPLLKLTHP